MEGGSGNGGQAAEVQFRNNSSAASAEFTVHGGHIGLSLPAGTSASGYGGQVTFYDQSSAGTAHIRNYGEDEYHGGTGAYTQFFDSSTAENAVIENIAATHGAGGATWFTNNSTAGNATITNHVGGTYEQRSRTEFIDNSSAGSATIYNESASLGAAGGFTRFRNTSTAANAVIINDGLNGAFAWAGIVQFYDDSRAGNATIRLRPNGDGGRMELYDHATAENSVTTIVSNPPGEFGTGGKVNFADDSTAGAALFVIQPQANGAIDFHNRANAGTANFTIGDPNIDYPFNDTKAGWVRFWDDASAANATFVVGSAYPDNRIQFFSRSTAANASFNVRPAGNLFFYGGTTAASATIDLAGGRAAAPAAVSCLSTAAARAAPRLPLMAGRSAVLAGRGSIFPTAVTPAARRCLPPAA